MSVKKFPCEGCGSIEWTVTDLHTCDQCDTSLSPERFMKMDDCKHDQGFEPYGKIINVMKCKKCGYPVKI